MTTNPPEDEAREWANQRCPEQGPEHIVWCMCKEDYLEGHKRGYSRALEEVEKELNLTIDEAPIFIGEEDRGYTIKVCEWLKKNITNLKAKGGA